MPLPVSRHRRFVRASLGVALLLALGAGSFASKAYAEDDEVEDTADTRFMKNFLSNLGLGTGTSPGIDYHERSPLVVPPTLTLPPPEAKSAAVVNPAWPKDPDMATTPKKTKVKRKALAGSQVEEDSMRQLSPNELAPVSKGRRAADADGPPAQQQGSLDSRTDQLSPAQLGHEGFTLGSVFGARDGKEVKFVKEPERSALTDPPVGLRTPSPKYSYGTKGKLEKTKEIGTDQAVFGVDK